MLADLVREWNEGIGAEYGVTLEFPPPNPHRAGWEGYLDTDEAHRVRAAQQVAEFGAALRKYPPALILGSNLAYLQLVGKAAFGGRAGGKFLILSQWSNERTFHHEMMHVLASAYDPWKATSRTPPEWPNPPGFVYGEPQPDLMGFVSKYAQTYHWEDYADTAAYIWHSTDEVHRRMSTDPVLRTKVRTVVAWWSSHGLTRFDHLLRRRRPPLPPWWRRRRRR